MGSILSVKSSPAGDNQLRQRPVAYAEASPPGDEDRLTPEQRERLAALDQLTPGDFAAVRQQEEILAETLTPDEFLAQLEAEHRLKPEVRSRRGIGFR